jgi:hypothetical protein
MNDVPQEIALKVEPLASQIEVRVSPNEAEFLESMLYPSEAELSGQLQSQWTYALVFAILGTFIAMAGAGGYQRFLQPFYLMAAIYVYSASTYMPKLKRAYRMMYETDASLRGQSVSTISPSGLTVRMSDESHAYAWQVFTHFVETDLSFLIFQSPNRLLYLPKRGLRRPEDVNALRQLLQDQISHPVGPQAPLRAFPIETLPTREQS